jgi:hypothetical protein
MGGTRSRIEVDRLPGSAIDFSLFDVKHAKCFLQARAFSRFKSHRIIDHNPVATW